MPTLMLTLIMTAWSGAPDGISADDPEPWEDAWSQIVDGPPGCWEVVGKASWRYDGGRMGGIAGDAVFVGRLNDGQWQGLMTRSMGESQRRRRQEPMRVYPHDETRFIPMVGKRRPAMLATQDDGKQILTAMIDAWGTSTMTVWSRWEEEERAVVLRRSLPIGTTSEEGEMRVSFAEGQPYPTHMEVTFPDRFPLPDRRIVTIRDASAQIRAMEAGGMVFPESETFSFEARVLGFRLTGAQTIAYKSFRPCDHPSDDATPAISD